jgi:hypothetical protein
MEGQRQGVGPRKHPRQRDAHKETRMVGRSHGTGGAEPPAGGCKLSSLSLVLSLSHMLCFGSRGRLLDVRAAKFAAHSSALEGGCWV